LKTDCKTSEHVRELDGVRGLAILMVLVYHMFSFRMRFQHWAGAAGLIASLTQPLWLGVDLFFVLSGFLITGVLLDGKSQPHGLRKFFVRRALRILPLYYLVLVVIWFFYRNSHAFVALGFVYLANVAPLFGIEMINTPLWSLSVEEHFYLGWPWVVHFLRRRTVVVIALALCILEPAARLLAFPRDVYFYSWFRFDGLAYGALLACFIRSSYFTRERAIRIMSALSLAALLVAGIGLPLGLGHRRNALGTALQFFPAQLLFSALVLAAVVFSRHRGTQPLRWGVLRLAGDLSYCMYLIHMMVAGALDGWFGWRGELTFAVTALRAALIMACTFAIALLSRSYLEMPARNSWRFFMPAAPRPELANVGR